MYYTINIWCFSEERYALLTKEVDYKEYLFLLNQTDLELLKDTENFYVLKNKHPVSRFYLADTIDQQNFTNLKPISYTQASPVKFNAEAVEGYIVFVPPNLDSDYWELDSVPSLAQVICSLSCRGREDIDIL